MNKIYNNGLFDLFLQKPALIIDDGLFNGESEILRIKDDFESEGACFLKYDSIPDEKCWKGLGSVSFAILDWNLYGIKKEELGLTGIGGSPLTTINEEKIIQFISYMIKEYMTPIFVITQEDTSYVINRLSASDITEKAIQQGQITVYSKNYINKKRIKSVINKWCKNNPAIYVLKELDKSSDKAMTTLFRGMTSIDNRWPAVVYDTLKADSSMDVNREFFEFLIDSFVGRMDTPFFDEKIIGKVPRHLEDDEIIRLYSDAKIVSYDVQPTGPCTGDVYIDDSCKNIFINITAGCDLKRKAHIFLKGNKITEYPYDKKTGLIQKNNSQIIPLFLDKACVEFCFSSYFCIEFENSNYQEYTFDIGNGNQRLCKRYGKLIHPYITTIQERFAHHISRQGMIRHPDKVLRNNRKKKKRKTSRNI